VKDRLSPEAFYARALSRAERLRLAEARELQGLDEEIALLRVKLQRLAEEHPERLDLLFKGVGLLVRAVSVRYKLSPSSQEDLAASISGVLKGIGGALGLEDGRGAEGD